MKPLFINVGLATIKNVERAINVAETLGYSYTPHDRSYLVSNYPNQSVGLFFNSYGKLQLHGRREDITPHHLSTGTVQLDLAPFYDPVMIKLNDTYSAVLHKDHVHVGCQKFSNAVILQLAEAIKQKQ